MLLCPINHLSEGINQWKIQCVDTKYRVLEEELFLNHIMHRNGKSKVLTENIEKNMTVRRDSYFRLKGAE